MRYFFSLIIKGTQSIIDQDEVFHIISPGSSLSAPGSKKNQRSLAHALAVETDPQLRQALAEDKDMKVVFINASESVRSKQQQKYEQMTRYRKALHLLKPTSRSCPCSHSFFCVCFFLLFYIVGFSVFCAISTRDISCTCSFS